MRLIVHFRDRFSRRDPAAVMGDLLLSASTSGDNTDDFVDMFPCRFDDVTLPMLGVAFFERGWLAPNSFDIHSSDRVALGDIGYVTEDGDL